MKVTMMTTMKTMVMTMKEVVACLPSWADPPVAHFQLFNHYDNDDDDSDNGDDDYDDDDDDDEVLMILMTMMMILSKEPHLFSTYVGVKASPETSFCSDFYNDDTMMTMLSTSLCSIRQLFCKFSFYRP